MIIQVMEHVRGHDFGRIVNLCMPLPLGRKISKLQKFQRGQNVARGFKTKKCRVHQLGVGAEPEMVKCPVEAGF